MEDFLQLAGRNVLVCGVANRKSVAYAVGKTLQSAGAEVYYSVRSEARRESLAKQVDPARIFLCDVEDEQQIKRLAEQVSTTIGTLHGLVHSIAFADYEGGPKPFHEVSKSQFLRALDVSCYSFTALAGALRDCLAEDASAVTISISTTTMASENYGFMAPIKAALDSSLAFLAKSFSRFSRVRFNAVGPGLLKTSASAGIPKYVDSYLFAEQATLRGQAVQTQEVADVVAFLLSPRSSGINGQKLVIDAGMGLNYFDAEIVRRVVEG